MNSRPLFPGWTYISGDWEYQVDLDCYEVAYEAIITGHWSGGVSAKVTRNVMDAIAARQTFFSAEHHDTFDPITPDGNGYRVGNFEAPDDDTQAEWILPDENGLFSVPGWAWTIVEPDGNDRVLHRVRARGEIGPRSYTIGLPVTISVHPDGTVEWEIDKSEAAQDLDEHTEPGTYTEAQILADRAIVAAAVKEGR